MFMAGLHIYSQAFLPSVLLMMPPVNVMLPNGPLVVFPSEFISYNPLLPKGACHPNPGSLGFIACTMF